MRKIVVSLIAFLLMFPTVSAEIKSGHVRWPEPEVVRDLHTTFSYTIGTTAMFTFGLTDSPEWIKQIENHETDPEGCWLVVPIWFYLEQGPDSGRSFEYSQFWIQDDAVAYQYDPLATDAYIGSMQSISTSDIYYPNPNYPGPEKQQSAVVFDLPCDLRDLRLRFSSKVEITGVTVDEGSPVAT